MQAPDTELDTIEMPLARASSLLELVPSLCRLQSAMEIAKTAASALAPRPTLCGMAFCSLPRDPRPVSLSDWSLVTYPLCPGAPEDPAPASRRMTPRPWYGVRKPR